MRRVRTKKTGVERRVRTLLRRKGVSFRGNVRSLPSTPDLVFGKEKVVVFVNGCFWHGCPTCFRPPKHNRKWWLRKIEKNRARDLRVSRAIRARGYSVIHLWEHDSDERIEKRLNSALRTGLRPD
jgi:DNA mismatch endonuclease (patch repair protein)